MKIALITLFPEMFAAVTDYGISSRAVKDGLLEITSYNPRDFTEDRHQTVDARPYGPVLLPPPQAALPPPAAASRQPAAATSRR